MGQLLNVEMWVKCSLLSLKHPGQSKIIIEKISQFRFTFCIECQPRRSWGNLPQGLSDIEHSSYSLQTMKNEHGLYN